MLPFAQPLIVVTTILDRPVKRWTGVKHRIRAHPFCRKYPYPYRCRRRSLLTYFAFSLFLHHSDLQLLAIHSVDERAIRHLISEICQIDFYQQFMELVDVATVMYIVRRPGDPHHQGTTMPSAESRVPRISLFSFVQHRKNSKEICVPPQAQVPSRLIIGHLDRETCFRPPALAAFHS